MPIVYSFVPIELRRGVDAAAFEKFWLTEYGPLGGKLGWSAHLLRADRGDRAGCYAVLWEIPSVESRDCIMPAPGRISDEGIRLIGPEFQLLGDALDAYVADWPFTDYVELG